MSPAHAELAVSIADHAVRSEIELYARCVPADNGSHLWHLDQPSIPETSSDAEDWRAIVDTAVRYIEARGDALPFVMHRRGNVVWFENRA